MIAEYTTKDGQFTLRVFSTMYIDYGLEISNQEGKTVYYNPCCLSNESYGCHFEKEDGEPLDEGIPWTEQEWKECLSGEAAEFIEGYVTWRT